MRRVSWSWGRDISKLNGRTVGGVCHSHNLRLHLVFEEKEVIHGDITATFRTVTRLFHAGFLVLIMGEIDFSQQG